MGLRGPRDWRRTAMRAAEYMRRTFAGDPAIGASLEEKSFMAEQKSGSDLDVFEGLSKKNAAADEAPTPFAPVGQRASPSCPPRRATRRCSACLRPPDFRPVPAKGHSQPRPGAAPANSGPPAGGRASVPPPPARCGDGPISPRAPPWPAWLEPRCSSGLCAPRRSLRRRQTARWIGTSPASRQRSQAPVPVRLRSKSKWTGTRTRKRSVFEKNETTTVFERPDGLAAGPVKPLPAAGMMPPTPARTLPGPGVSNLPPPPAPPAPFLGASPFARQAPRRFASREAHRASLRHRRARSLRPPSPHPRAIAPASPA